MENKSKTGLYVLAGSVLIAGAILYNSGKIGDISSELINGFNTVDTALTVSNEIQNKLYESDTAKAKGTTADPFNVDALVSNQEPITEGDSIFDAGKSYKDSSLAVYFNSKEFLIKKYDVPKSVYAPSSKGSSKKNRTYRTNKTDYSSSKTKGNSGSSNNNSSSSNNNGTTSTSATGLEGYIDGKAPVNGTAANGENNNGCIDCIDVYDIVSGEAGNYVKNKIENK